MASIVSLVAMVGAASTAQEKYAAAMAREQAIRNVMASDETALRVEDVRDVVAAYQEIVRVYPASAYSDNALWQAGRLSLDAFLRFGEERDRTTGLRLLRLLRTEYPASSLVKNLTDETARVDGAGAGGARDAGGPKGPPLQGPPRVGTGLQAGPTAKIATIKDIRREVLRDAVRVTIELDREVAFHDERILNPVRVFVDLPSTRAAAALVDKTLRFGDGDLVHQVRIGRHPNNMTRVVLDAADVSNYSVYPLYNPFRLVIDCVKEPPPLVPRTTIASTSAVVVSEPSAAPRPTLTARSSAPPASMLPQLPAETLPPPSPSPSTSPVAVLTSTTPPATAPSKNVGGGYSMARQLGLSVSRIVIDPGHGGHDPGAKGKSINEAELVLDIALRVEKILQQSDSGTEVILTRRTDDFVSLQERTAIANREGADLFLSLHANASPNAAAHGVETYFLNFATNMTAASVAARENAASGQAMGALPEFVRSIALTNKLDESRDFATAVQRALVEGLRKSNKTVKDLGVKQAPFVVLIGAAMPSVLAEISFVTNAQEAKLLRGSAYRQRIAEALASAIGRYRHSLQTVAAVTHP